MPESSQERFGRVAERYLTSKDHALPEGMPDVVAHLEPMDGLVLDVGTGAGHTAYALAERATRVAAVGYHAGDAQGRGEGSRNAGVIQH